jgi:hypothetical protein
MVTMYWMVYCHHNVIQIIFLKHRYMLIGILMLLISIYVSYIKLLRFLKNSLNVKKSSIAIIRNLIDDNTLIY